MASRRAQDSATRSSSTALAVQTGVTQADDALVERAIHTLRAVCVTGAVQMMAQAGEYLIENFFAGDLEAARSQHPAKPVALRHLIERAPELGLRPSQLRRCVPFALQVRGLGARISNKLLQDHHFALLALRDAREKREIAEIAVEDRWSTRHLRQKIRELQKPHPGGKRPAPAAVTLLHRLERLLKEFDASKSAESLDRISAGDAKHLRAVARAGEETLAKLRRALTR